MDRLASPSSSHATAPTVAVRGRHYRTLEPIEVVHREGTIVSLRRTSPSQLQEATDTLLAPGLIDLQVNGFAGVDFCDPDLTTAAVRRVVDQLRAGGVTRFLPTLITHSLDRFAVALERLVTAIREDPVVARGILGFHLEGPWISDEDGPRGAHAREFIRDPSWLDFERLQQSAEGRIRLVTLAPERPGAIPFIRDLVASGVRVALGHTAADRPTILAAVDAGATLATHLGNGMASTIDRHHNPLWDQLGEDRLWTSLIVDGHHLPPHVVQSLVRAKGRDRILLVSDAVQFAGLPPGEYAWQGKRLEVRADGFIGIVGEPRLAGSGLELLRGVENLAAFARIPLADALDAASVHPAHYLGLENELGSLAPGYPADFLVLCPDLSTGRLQTTVIEP